MLAWRRSVRPTTGRRALAVLALVALLSTGCADADSPAPTAATAATLTSPSAPATGATAAPPSTPPAAPEPSEDQAVEVRITVTDGRVTPPFDRVEIPRGSTVRLTVTSDAADEVHVHEPYEQELALEAGKPATAEFVADQPGLVEVELHEAGKQLAQLLVR